MKKLLLGLLFVFLVACSSGETQEVATTEPVATTPAMEATPTETATAPALAETVTEPAPKVAAEPSSLFDFEASMLSGAKCISTQEGQTATVYFKNGKMRMDTLPVDAHAIFDATTMYAWTGEQGTKMSLTDLKKMAKDAGSQVKTPDQVTQEMRDPNVHCEAATISDSQFVPPSDVQFQDLAEMMKQYQMPSQ